MERGKGQAEIERRRGEPGERPAAARGERPERRRGRALQQDVGDDDAAQPQRQAERRVGRDHHRQIFVAVEGVARGDDAAGERVDRERVGIGAMRHGLHRGEGRLGDVDELELRRAHQPEAQLRRGEEHAGPQDEPARRVSRRRARPLAEPQQQRQQRRNDRDRGERHEPVPARHFLQREHRKRIEKFGDDERQHPRAS